MEATVACTCGRSFELAGDPEEKCPACGAVLLVRKPCTVLVGAARTFRWPAHCVVCGTHEPDSQYREQACVYFSESTSSAGTTTYRTTSSTMRDYEIPICERCDEPRRLYDKLTYRLVMPVLFAGIAAVVLFGLFAAWVLFASFDFARNYSRWALLWQGSAVVGAYGGGMLLVGGLQSLIVRRRYPVSRRIGDAWRCPVIFSLAREEEIRFTNGAYARMFAELHGYQVKSAGKKSRAG
jgi:hypothetical protein